MSAIINRNLEEVQMSCNDDRHIACEDCGTLNATLAKVDMDFQYGLGADEVTLVARVPMWHCAACGFQWTAPGAEKAQNEEISAYLGRLRPTEIRAIRIAAGLTQAEFASKLHVGEASVKRWEAGSIVPSKSSNKLLTDFRADAASASIEQSATFRRGRFRTSAPERRQHAARLFDMSAPFPFAQAA